MLFQEALSELRKGNCVTRAGWTDSSYLALLPHVTMIWRVVSVPNPAAGNWMPFVADLEADDWCLLDSNGLIINAANAQTVIPGADAPQA